MLGGVEVAAQHVDIKAHRADVAGNVLQYGGVLLRHAGGRHQVFDLIADVLGRLHRLVLVEDGQRALQLVQQRIDAGQRRPAGCVEVVIVEHLLDLAQAGFHFDRQHGDCLSLGDLARQVALPLRCVRRRLARCQRQQACADHFGVVGKIVGQLAHLVESLLDEQHGGGHLHAELVAAAGGDRIAGGARQLAQQLRQGRRAQLVAGAGQGRQRLVKILFELDARFGGDAVPVGLGLGQRVLGGFQGLRIDAAVAAAVVIGRHHAGQAVGAAQQLGVVGRRAGGGDEKQGVAQHCLGQAGLPLRQPADLQVDQAEQLFDVEVAGDLAAGDQFGEAAHGQPEGARRRIDLGLFDQGDGLGQGVGIGALGGGVGAFQKRQQRFFEACAVGGVIGRERRAGGRQRHRRRQVDEQQVGRVDALGPERFLQGAVIGKQARRLRRLSARRHQFVEVFGDRLKRVGNGGAAGGIDRQGTVAHALDQGLGRAGEQADAFDVDHLQGAVGLVQVGAGMLKTGDAGVARTIERLGEGAARAVQGIVDFADHPRQGAGVEIGRGRCGQRGMIGHGRIP